MATHPHGPEDPDNPQKNRHIIERAQKQDARGVAAAAILESDALRMMEWLGEAPLRTITSKGMRDWIEAQQPPWTPGYRVAVRAKVQDALSQSVIASGPQVRDRLLTLIDRLIPECSTYRTGTAPSVPGEGGGGTVVLRDPVTGEYLKEIEHSAVQGYVKIVADLTGVSQKEPHVIEHRFVVHAPEKIKNAEQWVKSIEAPSDA